MSPQDDRVQLIRLAEHLLHESEAMIKHVARARGWFAAVLLGIGLALVVLVVTAEVLDPSRLGSIEFISLLVAGGAMSSAAPVAHTAPERRFVRLSEQALRQIERTFQDRRTSTTDNRDGSRL